MRPITGFLLLGVGLLLNACTPTPDTTAPELALSATPTTITGSGTVTLTATASDNIGVTKVSFYQGTTLLNEDATVPYEAAETVPAQTTSGKRVYRAVALDEAGNKTEKSVEVTTQPVPAAALPNLEVRFSKGAGQYAFSDAQGIGRKVSLYVNNYPAPSTLLAESTVGQDYKLTLPEISLDKLTPLLIAPVVSAGCEGNFGVSEAGLRILVETSFSVDTTGLTASGSLGMYLHNPDGSTPQATPRLSGGFPNQFWYADRAATMNGIVTCTNGSSKSKYMFDMNLKKGWNFVQQSYSYEASTQTAAIGYKTLAASSVILAPSGN